MKTARMVHLDGQVEQKLFVGVPKPRLFSYQKGEHGNITGRIYFDIDPDQDIKANTITYTEAESPKPQ